MAQSAHNPGKNFIFVPGTFSKYRLSKKFSGCFELHCFSGQQQKTLYPTNMVKNSWPLHETGSEKIVILCHGFRSTKETTTITNLAIALENEGISAFRFDFAGNGKAVGSEGVCGASVASKYHGIRTFVNVSGRYDLREMQKIGCFQ
ncbi:uncharacterized protein Pyn_02841 [Prunus yedoensis var. nudiflora]|uniref:Serine aminopeptidase S33 domain-containing protein n=1 Tax=Prunus yedoensis var. nudiflora TaxID=2094558 RepID=A0A314ZCE3_PRUYE|nr:uncharacterized protein Pyn_02841 [Prunus yedoensis var. nudiflora]